MNFSKAGNVQVPNPPTVEACLDYRAQVQSALHETHTNILNCLTGPAKIGYGKSCSISTHTVSTELQAWPQCGAWSDQECDLYRQVDDAETCLKVAKGSATQEEKSQLKIKAINESEVAFDRSINTFHQTIAAWNNPKIFLLNAVGAKSKIALLAEFTNRNGEFTGRGRTLMQETYDFIFNRTARNKRLYSTNPIISAIQGGIADKIYESHSATIRELEILSSQISEFTIEPHINHSKFRNYESLGCNLLSQPAAADMSMDSPDLFEALVNSCKHN